MVVGVRCLNSDGLINSVRRYNFNLFLKKIGCSSRSMNGIMSLTERLLHLGCGRLIPLFVG